MCRHPLNSSQGPSTSPGGPPGLTALRRALMALLKVAPEIGGTQERLLTQMALHREQVVGSVGLSHLNQPGILPLSKLPLPWDSWGTKKFIF